MYIDMRISGICTGSTVEIKIKAFKKHDREITWWHFITCIIQEVKLNYYYGFLLSKDLKLIYYLEILSNRKQLVNHLFLSCIQGCWYVCVIPLILEAGREQQKMSSFLYFPQNSFLNHLQQGTTGIVTWVDNLLDLFLFFYVIFYPFSFAVKPGNKTLTDELESTGHLLIPVSTIPLLTCLPFSNCPGLVQGKSWVWCRYQPYGVDDLLKKKKNNSQTRKLEIYNWVGFLCWAHYWLGHNRFWTALIMQHVGFQVGF